MNQGLAAGLLLDPTVDLIREVRRIRNFGFPDAFVVHTDGQHIYTRDAGYDRRQLNIGLAAHPYYPWDMMRIGVGFPMQDQANAAVMDYVTFRSSVMANPQGFDAVYTTILGGYGELDDDTKVWAPLSHAVVSDTGEGRWRFFGRRLTLTDDAALLASIPALARAVVDVFRQIDTAPF